MTTEYEKAKAYVAVINRQYETASDKLRSIKGVSSGQLGLTPDSVKNTSEYKQASKEYHRAFNVLRDVNSQFIKKFNKEIRADRAQKRGIKS